MIKKLIKLVIGLMALTWFAKRVLHHHLRCDNDSDSEDDTPSSWH